MMTEREERELEKLKTVKDYYDELESVFDLAGEVPEKQLEKLTALLMRNLRKKYKYIIKISKSFRKRQSLFSRLRDKRLEKLRDSELEEEEIEEIEQPIQQPEVQLIEITQTTENDKMLTW